MPDEIRYEVDDFSFDDGRGFSAYVPVAVRRARAEAARQAMIEAGEKPSPIKVKGRILCTSFWGKAWCSNIEKQADLASRLPPGRTYVRRGAIVDLKIDQGLVKARVQGSELYEIKITIELMKPKRWAKIVERCTGHIDSLVDLIAGNLSEPIMRIVTDPKDGIMPCSTELSFKCTCPDWASMCKHVAATLYGIGHRLDSEPELLFRLRGVDPSELFALAVASTVASADKAQRQSDIAEDDLGAIFGIDFAP